jgi:3'-5' exonuclease
MKVYHQELKHLLIIDIETVACVDNHNELSEEMSFFWGKKAKIYAEEIPDPSEAFTKYASLHAEFAKIVSIGVGFFYLNENQTLDLRVKSISNDNEKQLLKDFKELLENRLKTQRRLVAHNGREFDYPFLCRRLLIHQLGLRLLAHLFGLPPYEDRIDGSMVSSIYHKDNDLERIAAYCRNDVITTAQLYLCMQNFPIVKEENIIEV